MTDAEIIKSYEWCIGGTQGKCRNCHLEGTAFCEEELKELVLGLINRQKTEIERAQKSNKEYGICTLLGDCLVYSKNLHDYNKMKRSLKLGAIKDFTERLKNEIINDTAYSSDCNQHSGYYDYSIKIGDIPEYIDDLLKEMESKYND